MDVLFFFLVGMFVGYVGGSIADAIEKRLDK